MEKCKCCGRIKRPGECHGQKRSREMHWSVKKLLALQDKINQQK